MDKKDNRLLVEFEMVVDLDLALFKLMKDKYNSDILDKDIMSLTHEIDIIKFMITRKCINPLELMIPNHDSKNIYYQLMDDDELLYYANVCDIFLLMVTFLREASSIDITVLCENKSQEDYIKKCNKNINTIISSRETVDLNNYDVLYVKYLASLYKYKEVRGKNIYLANARYNMDDEIPLFPNRQLISVFADVNLFKTIDLYKDIRYNKLLRDKRK